MKKTLAIVLALVMVSLCSMALAADADCTVKRVDGGHQLDFLPTSGDQGWFVSQPVIVRSNGDVYDAVSPFAPRISSSTKIEYVGEYNYTKNAAGKYAIVENKWGDYLRPYSTGFDWMEDAVNGALLIRVKQLLPQ